MVLACMHLHTRTHINIWHALWENRNQSISQFRNCSPNALKNNNNMNGSLNRSSEWNESGTHNRPMNAYDAYRHLRFPNIQLPNICWSFVHQINRRRPIRHGWDRAKQSETGRDRATIDWINITVPTSCAIKSKLLFVFKSLTVRFMPTTQQKKLKEKRTVESVFCCLVRDGSIYDGDGVGKILVKNVRETIEW